MISYSRSTNKKDDCLMITMHCINIEKYPFLDTIFTGKVQCPDFTLFLPGLYEHVLLALVLN